MRNTAQSHGASTEGQPTVRYEPAALEIASQTVAAANESLLELLVKHAADRARTFPLPRSLRSRLAALNESQRTAIANCGITIVDLELENAQFWHHAKHPDFHADHLSFPVWLDHGDALSLTLSALFATLQVVRSTPCLAPFLLNMPGPVVSVFATMDQRALLSIARRFPHLFRSRWREQSEVWTGILNLATEEDPIDQSRLNRHCLTLRGASTLQVQAYGPRR
jgi:hypothetical protein